MHFTQDQTGGINLIREYSPGEVRINDTRTRCSLIVAARTLSMLEDVMSVEDLTTRHADLLNAQHPEVVLIGSGARQKFPRREFLDEFVRLQIGIEVMTTPAACRTYNVLMSERRSAIALLIP